MKECWRLGWEGGRHDGRGAGGWMGGGGRLDGSKIGWEGGWMTRSRLGGA